MDSKWFYIAAMVIVCVYKAEDISKAVKPLLHQECPVLVEETNTKSVPEQ